MSIAVAADKLEFYDGTLIPISNTGAITTNFTLCVLIRRSYLIMIHPPFSLGTMSCPLFPPNRTEKRRAELR